MRVFLGPVEVAGYYAALQRGLEARGCTVVRVDLWADRRRYGIGKQPLFARAAMVAEKRSRDAGSSPARAIWSLLTSFCRWLLFARIALSCEALVFSFGSTITWWPRTELRLLRLL